MVPLTLARLDVRRDSEGVDDLQVGRLPGAAAQLLRPQPILERQGLARRRLLARRLEGRAALVPLVDDVWDRILAPHTVWRGGPDAGVPAALRGVERELRRLVPVPAQYARPDKIERDLVERGLRQRRSEGREPVVVAAPVVRPQRPAGLARATPVNNDIRWMLRRIQARMAAMSWQLTASTSPATASPAASSPSAPRKPARSS